MGHAREITLCKCLRDRAPNAGVHGVALTHAVTTEGVGKVQVGERGDRRIMIGGEAEARVLRVVTLEDEETVHNAFFDRSFREEE